MIYSKLDGRYLSIVDPDFREIIDVRARWYGASPWFKMVTYTQGHYVNINCTPYATFA